MANLSLFWAAWLCSAGSGRWTGCGASVGDVLMCEQAGTMSEEAVGKCDEAVRMCEEAFGMYDEVVGMCEGLYAGWGGLWVGEFDWYEQRAEKSAFGAACDGTLSPGL